MWYQILLFFRSWFIREYSPHSVWWWKTLNKKIRALLKPSFRKNLFNQFSDRRSSHPPRWGIVCRQGWLGFCYFLRTQHGPYRIVGTHVIQRGIRPGSVTMRSAANVVYWEREGCQQSKDSQRKWHIRSISDNCFYGDIDRDFFSHYRIALILRG